MKTHTIGFFVFLGWSALSTYFYVCKIKDLCYQKETSVISQITVNKAYTTDSLSNNLALKPVVKPENLLVFFEFDKSEYFFDSNASAYYDKSMAYMLGNPDAILSITGHTDSKGSDEYNLKLGLRRADVVRDFFESKGVPAEKLKIESKGEKEPAENNNTDRGRAGNRRSVITIKN